LRGARGTGFCFAAARRWKNSRVNIVALDKTGTLTTGELRVEKVESFPPGNENEIARLAYSLEKFPRIRSPAPSRATANSSGSSRSRLKILNPSPARVRAPGTAAAKSAWAAVNGSRKGRHADTIARVTATEAGFSEVWIESSDLVGRIILRDDIRPQAASVMDELRQEGLRSVVLTGDRAATAEHLRVELKLDDVRAELKPEQKVAAIRELSGQGLKVAMVGDGVNDAPSLAAAHIGVAMGARGSDAALEQADVVLMHDRLENFLAAFRLSQRAQRVIRQNLLISLGTVVVLVCFALAGKIPLTIGVVGHEGSTVVVVMNSLRLLLGGGQKVKL
jgi:Cd2+/Zn2+-exporting ATPase